MCNNEWHHTKHSVLRSHVVLCIRSYLRMMWLLDGRDSWLYLLDRDGRRSGGHLLLDATGRLLLRQGRRRMADLAGLGRGEIDDEHCAAVSVRVHFQYVGPDHGRLRSVAHGRLDDRHHVVGGGRLLGSGLDDRVRRTATQRRPSRYLGHHYLRGSAVDVEDAPQHLRVVYAHQHDFRVAVSAAQHFACGQNAPPL